MKGREVKAIRDARGESQAAFARVVGVTETTVWRWENGISPVSRPIATLLRTLAAVTPPALSEKIG